MKTMFSRRKPTGQEANNDGRYRRTYIDLSARTSLPASFLPLEGRLRYQETSLAPKLKIREDGNIKVRRRRTRTRTRTRTRRMAPTLLSAMLSIVFILTIPSTARAEDQAVGPTSIPSPTAPSTLNPSSKPTAGVELNTSAPSQSTKPSTKPTILLVPTSTPTSEPTTTPYPSSDPSSIPSDAPSTTPTSNPTVEPSLDNPSLASAKFRQMFTVGNGRLFTPLEIGLFEVLFPTYTSNFAPVEDVSSGRIESICEVTSQVGKQITGAKRFLRKEDSIGRMLQTFQAIEVDYIMSYNSLYTNVTTFPLDFQLYVNQNLVTVAQQLQLLGLNVTEAGQASRIIVQPIPTLAPTRSATPTTAPTMEPSVSSLPSFIPSDLPSLAPSAPQETLEPSGAITESPTQIISGQPTKRGSEPGGLTDNTVIVVSVVVAGSIVLIGLLLYYRKRKLHREIEYISNAAGSHRSNGQAQKHDEGSWNAAVLQPKQGDHKNAKALDSPNHLSAFRKYSSNAPPLAGAAGMVSPSESLVSNQSLLSAGNSMAGDSGDEADATGNLADEFDQYKDQNLEKMRADVEGNLAGFDGMMSQALTRALIDDDDANVDPTELLWGGQGKLRGAEIEASVLGEVTDWLKRQGGASVEVKRLFMQETLNKMVASVRHGVLGPDDASRSIHECAALLGLQLATEIPVTTLIITGMRKTATAMDMIDVFQEFGEISEAAVASNQRGFGILRFKTNQSVDRAMNRFRTEEIVVQDVAVHVKVLKPGSDNSE